MGTVLSVVDKVENHTETRGANAVEGNSPEVLTTIYEEQVNIAVLQRTLSDELSQYCQQLVEDKPNFNLRAVVKNERSVETLTTLLPEVANRTAFVEDIAELMDMYSCLFDLEEVGIRMQVVDRAMCPRFHTDKLACRLVTTYQGQGTEWLYNHDVDRSKLGMGSMGLSDKESRLYPGDLAIQQVDAGDIVLLKGDGWIGNEGLGAVHRSPAVAKGEKRIVMTMDFT